MNNRIFNRPSTRPRQSGIAAISLALLLLISAGMMLGGQYLISRTTDAKARVEEQQTTLRWAEDSLNSYAAVYGRLPCPASRRNQAEDCASGAKGWLPVLTLERFGSAPLPNFHVRPDVRYGVYRGTGTGAIDPDLTVASKTVVQPSPSELPVKDYPATDGGPIMSGPDLCAKLRGLYPMTANRWALAQQLSGGPGRQDRLNISYNGAPGNVLNVAYGLAVVAPGAGVSASALNAVPTSLRFENPDRLHDGHYSDLVKVADVGSLYRSIGCAASMASIDLLATAQSWTSDVKRLKQGTMDGALPPLQVMSSALFITADGLNLSSAVLSTLISVEKMSLAIAELALTCWDPLTIPECVNATAALATSIAGLSLSIVTVVTSEVSLAMDISSLALKAQLMKNAAAVPVWTGAEVLLQQAHQQGTGHE